MAKYELVLQNALLDNRPCDLLLGQGSILDIRTHDPDQVWETPHQDAAGAIVWPSCLDAHTHLREPGFEYKETILTGLEAAAAGGFGRVLVMANTTPVNDNPGTTRFILDQAQQSHPHGPRLYPIGALSKGLQGLELTPMAELAEAGCVAFSNDGNPVANSELFRRAVEYAADHGRLVIDHCEDPFLALGVGINEGKISSHLGLKGQPTVAESLHVSRDILLASYLDLPIHLAHISCRESVELIARAKGLGVPITAETCPHYLLWDETLIGDYDTLAKVNPPLRTADDVQALRQAIREGVIDCLVTDHAPHAMHEKNVPFVDAANGISGLETALSLTWQLVQDQVLSAKELINLWSYVPAKIFGLGEPSALKPGAAADFILFDPEEKWQVSPEVLSSKGKNTPCLGQTLSGRVSAHFLSGLCIYKAPGRD
jgi:dihydroorotase